MERNIVSIVLYNYRLDKILELICRIQLTNTNCIIYLVDNSEQNFSEHFNFNEGVFYFKTNSNLGFGKGHNISINYSINHKIKYCFVINYDIDFDNYVFVKMLDYIVKCTDVGMVMPKIFNGDNTLQWLPKLQPKPIYIIKRKLFQLTRGVLFKKFVNIYEARDFDYSLNYNFPNLSGCFILLNIDLLKQDALFDERFFLYFEDYDLSRRIASKYKTILLGSTFVRHDYQSLANKKFNLLFIFVKSYLQFYIKWGWFNSNEIEILNRKIFVAES